MEGITFDKNEETGEIVVAGAASVTLNPPQKSPEGIAALPVLKHSADTIHVDVTDITAETRARLEAMWTACGLSLIHI